jgi:chromosomal replication initiator protein
MLQDMNALWPKVLDELKKKVSEEQFNTWFKHLEPEERLGRKVGLRVPTPLYKEWLARRYKPLLDEVFSSVSNEPMSVAFTLDAPGEAYPKGPSGTAGMGVPLPLQSRLNKGYTFENFVVGPCNRLAHAASLSVVSSPGYTYNPLFLFGGPGTGKSHLLQAICLSLLSKNIKALYVSCEDFISHFIFALRSQQLEAFRRTYRALDAFLLDGVEYLSKSPSSREELFHTFNTLFNRQKLVVLASSCSPDTLSEIEERLVSRFMWGLVVELEPAGVEAKAAIASRMALSSGITLSKEASLFVAENSSNNLKELDRMVGLILSSFTNSSSLSLQEVSSVFGGFPLSRPPSVHIEEVLRAVSSFFRIPQSKLQSKNRTRTVSLPRQVAMYLARRFTSLSLEEVGGFLGGRDHSTVVHAEKKIKTLKAHDPEIGSIINQLEAVLQKGC